MPQNEPKPVAALPEIGDDVKNVAWNALLVSVEAGLRYVSTNLMTLDFGPRGFMFKPVAAAGIDWLIAFVYDKRTDLKG